MDTTRKAPPPVAAAASPTPATVAKGALRRLAQAKLEPTPANYARAYADEAGQPPPDTAKASTIDVAAEVKAQMKTASLAWAAQVERVARNLDRGGRQWSKARRKESLKRLFDGSRSDPQRLLQRLQSLMSAWEDDQPSNPAETGIEDPPLDARGQADTGQWPTLVATLHSTVRAALPDDVPRALALADELAQLADAVAAEGASPERAAAIDSACQRARQFLATRHHLVGELSALCRELTAGLGELVENDSWTQGQCLTMTQALQGDEGLSVRSLRAAGAVLAQTREQQQRVRGERQAARDALKQLIHDMLLEVGELDAHAGRFQAATAVHAQAIAEADTLEGLADVVKALMQDTRAVQAAVGVSQQRLQADSSRAGALEGKVRELESELRRLSDEVTTDALTQVANRRGLTQAFEAESARCQRDASAGAALAVALIDIDNFKKLNDSLGHAAGDVALKTLAAAVRERLRPQDHLARFGGEEFVVLLPGTAVTEGQQALTRLQRSLSEALFLHNGHEVFVTFSAGVTAWRQGETLDAALERADEGLYEAKRSGKNRTCIA